MLNGYFLRIYIHKMEQEMSDTPVAKNHQLVSWDVTKLQVHSGLPIALRANFKKTCPEQSSTLCNTAKSKSYHIRYNDSNSVKV